MPTGRSRSSRRSDDGASDGEQLLDLLSSLQPSARSQSDRHTWRSGLIPPCLESPHRIPSSFPVPSATLAKVPSLNHPDLSRGQRRYLHSTAQIYSLDSTKRSLSDSYYGLLMSELLRGGGTRDSHKRYTGWIYGNHKRLFETNPTIWRSRKLPSSGREAVIAEQKAEDRTEKDRNAAASSRSGRDSHRWQRRENDTDAEAAASSTPAAATGKSTAVSSASSKRSSLHSAGPRRRRTSDKDEAPRVRPTSKSRPAGRDVDNVSYDEDADAMEDGPRPRDLSRIMF